MLDKYKEEYIKNCIIAGKYTILPTIISTGKVLKISCLGSLEKEGYEHGFLYLTKNSSIKEHKHNDNIELYRLVSGNQKFSDEICLLGEKHKIDTVNSDTIIETFKLNKNYLKNISNTSLLNEYLKVILEDTLWQLNEIIKLLYINKDNYDCISTLYQIDLNQINKIKEIYFDSNISLSNTNSNIVLPVKRYKKSLN